MVSPSAGRPMKSPLDPLEGLPELIDLDTTRPVRITAAKRVDALSEYISKIEQQRALVSTLQAPLLAVQYDGLDFVAASVFVFLLTYQFPVWLAMLLVAGFQILASRRR